MKAKAQQQQMKATDIQSHLENMKGKKYEYANELHVVKSYIINAEDEKFTLVTDKNQFPRKFESATSFFQYWTQPVELVGKKPGTMVVVNSPKNTPPLDTSSPHDPKNMPALISEEDTNLTNYLVTTLKEGIEKVKANPGYIPQAKSINNNINSILHVQRLKLEMMKEMSKLGGRRRRNDDD